MEVVKSKSTTGIDLDPPDSGDDDGNDDDSNWSDDGSDVQVLKRKKRSPPKVVKKKVMKETTSKAAPKKVRSLEEIFALCRREESILNADLEPFYGLSKAEIAAHKKDIGKFYIFIFIYFNLF